jgi:RimJ/RimL family protein N-acetyltransferase
MGTMSEPARASAFSQQTTLRNGTPVLIRVAAAADRDKFVEAFDKLEPNSIYTRFFSVRKGLTTAELERLGATDLASHVTLAALVGSAPDETVIGGASYVALPAGAGTRSAEVAFTIEEDYQGQGLASQLLSTLVAIARQHGVGHFEADVLAGNASMLKVFERSGLPLSKARDGGVIHVKMNLRHDGDKP